MKKKAHEVPLNKRGKQLLFWMPNEYHRLLKSRSKVIDVPMSYILNGLIKNYLIKEGLLQEDEAHGA